MGYMYTGGELHLETAAGVTVGDSWSSLAAAYPDVQHSYDPDVGYWAWGPSGPDSVYGSGLGGFLSPESNYFLQLFLSPLPPVGSTFVAAIVSGDILERALFYC